MKELIETIARIATALEFIGNEISRANRKQDLAAMKAEKRAKAVRGKAADVLANIPVSPAAAQAGAKALRRATSR